MVILCLHVQFRSETHDVVYWPEQWEITPVVTGRTTDTAVRKESDQVRILLNKDR